MATLLIFGFCIMVSSLELQTPPQGTPTAGPPFRLVHDHLQRELDRASADGYAVAMARPAYDLAVLRRRSADEPVDAYHVLNGKKAIEQGLAQGYRALPGTLDVKGGALVAIASGEGEPYESLLLQTNRTSTLDKEIRDARRKGFYVVGLASDGSGHAALLERRRSEPAQVAAAGEMALIAANRQDTLQRELSERANAGYRLEQASAWKEMLLIVEQAHESPSVEYRVLSTTKSSTFEREMNAAAANGFRLAAGTLHAIQKGSVLGMAATGYEYIGIMEKSTADAPVTDYAIIGAKRIGTLAREFDAAVAKGCRPVAMTLGYTSQDILVVFECSR